MSRFDDPLVLSARQSVASARRLLAALAGDDWVVVVRELAARLTPYHYAYLASEMLGQFAQRQAPGDATLEWALELHEWTSTPTLDRWGRQVDDPLPGLTRTQAREVIVDETLLPRAVRAVDDAEAAPSVLYAPVRQASLSPRAPSPKAFAAPAEPAPPPATGRLDPHVEVWLQAKAPQALAPGAEDIVEVFVSRAGHVLPGVPGLVVAAQRNEPVTVLLSVLGDALEVTGPRLLRLAMPAGSARATGLFEIRALRDGLGELALVFRQGVRELGQLRLVLRVGGGMPCMPCGSARATAAPTPGDEAASPLWLDVEPVTAGHELRYRYRVTRAALELDHAEFFTPLLCAQPGVAARSEPEFVRRIYERLTNKMLRSGASARAFDDELRATAEDLAAQLLPPELLELLWQQRDRIGTLRLLSWEPFVPWELLRLHRPGGSSEGCHLGEFGLVRWLSGRSARRRLALARWSYLAATYPNNPADDVVEDVAYFTHTLPQRHIEPVRIPAAYDALSEALENPDYDVLHLACHGEAEHDAIDEATLFLTDTLEQGRVRPVGMSARVLGSIARLQDRRPLVFINACSAGRLGMSISAWGGWPRRLIDRGAGAVVGASWPVLDKRSNAFATVFYDTLLDGGTLAAAARAARKSSVSSGDATWLAFKIFGDPAARREPT